MIGEEIPQVHFPGGHVPETIEMQAASQKSPATMEKSRCKISLPALKPVGDNQHAAEIEPFSIPGEQPPGETFLPKKRLP